MAVDVNITQNTLTFSQGEEYNIVKNNFTTNNQSIDSKLHL